MHDLEKINKYKLNLVIYVILFGFLLIILALINWQIIDSQRFIAIANERYKVGTIPSVRGTILANDGSTLAYSEPRFDVYIWLPEIELAEKNKLQTRREFISKVSAIIGMAEEDLENILNSGPKWIRIAQMVDLESKNKLESLRRDNNSDRSLRGMQFEYVNKRIYPENNLASHILGFMGKDSNALPIGVGGLEQYWEGSLKPLEGMTTGEFDSYGNPITIGSQTKLEAKPGVTLYTTIDKYLQSVLEQQVRAGREKFKSKSVTAILMDPKTGAIIAMANAPDYDPNEYYREVDGIVFGNPAISTPYEIGSVAKAYTLAAAIDLEKLTATDIILPNGHKGCEIISPNPKPEYSCFNNKDRDKFDCICTYDRRPYTKSVNSTEAMINSDNIAFRHIALTMSYQEFHSYLAKFGIGKLTGIEISGESTGLLKPHEKWNYADQAVYSYGHSYQITPLQAISAFAAIGNNGERMQPYIVSKVEDSNGKVTNFKPILVERVIRPESSMIMNDILYQTYLANINDPRYRHLNKYYIGIKSGTALIPHKDRPGYSSKINATYIGYDASPERKFVLLIKIEEPEVGDLSYQNAKVLWFDTFMAIKDYIGVKEYR
jgi:cell division protein FtsI/penicillin-binding protein 2